MPTCSNLSYMLLNLVGELGEFSSKIAKHIRKGDLIIHENDMISDMPFDKAMELRSLLKKEAGDMLWQISGLCHIMGWSLEEVAVMNLEKLASNKERSMIEGDGDNR